ncbi:hypothetical protein ACFTAO_14300 [Paenibacillus rhizoplanae]
MLFFNSAWTHKFDAFRGVVIRGNVVEKIHRDGILVRASASPLIEYNKTKSIGEACEVNTSIVNYLEDITVVAAQWAYYTKGAIFPVQRGLRYPDAGRRRSAVGLRYRGARQHLPVQFQL